MFRRRMLNVEPVETPEEAIEISAMDVGSLVHECLDELISKCTQRGRRPGFGQPWTDVQGQRLRAIASANADAFETEGRKGHPLMWARDRTNVLPLQTTKPPTSWWGAS